MESLGHLTWYIIFDTELDRARLLDRLDRSGLPEFAPAAIQAGDAFRRATHMLERLHVAQGDTTLVNWPVREVRDTDQQIVRHLVRETVDAAQVRLDYRAVLALGLDRRPAPFGRIRSRRTRPRPSRLRSTPRGPPSRDTRARIGAGISGSWCSGC